VTPNFASNTSVGKIQAGRLVGSPLKKLIFVSYKSIKHPPINEMPNVIINEALTPNLTKKRPKQICARISLTALNMLLKLILPGKYFSKKEIK